MSHIYRPVCMQRLKLNSWKPSDRRRSTEMAGIEWLLSWDLSRCFSLSSSSQYMHLYWSRFVSLWLTMESWIICSILRMSVSGWHEAGFPYESSLSTVAQQLCPLWMGPCLPPLPELQPGFTTLSQNPELEVTAWISFSWEGDTPGLLKGINCFWDHILGMEQKSDSMSMVV